MYAVCIFDLSKRLKMTTKQKTLQTILQALTGVEMEITIRGERSFTFSFEGQNESACSKLVSYFKSAAKSVAASYHSDIDMTSIFMEA